jgi:hypothetical protein
MWLPGKLSGDIVAAVGTESNRGFDLPLSKSRFNISNGLNQDRHDLCGVLGNFQR